MKDKRIVFMGTPDFAVESLKALVESGYNVVGVVTVPDKPAGRGQKLSSSAVKKYAETLNVPILQPVKMRDPQFLQELEDLKADLQIVVAFRILPEVVWSMPPLGTFNLHGSLLPQYRGAAPINWAIINGEKKTGVTTFFLDKDIDTGNVIFFEEVTIEDTDCAGTLHDKLMTVGSKLVCKTVEQIFSGKVNAVAQEKIIAQTDAKLNDAPKIFKDDCRILWDNNLDTVYDFIRGLSPYPAAWTEMISDELGKCVSVKIFETEIISQPHTNPVGTIVTDGKDYMHIAAHNGFLNILSIQPSGKKRMEVKDFLRGFRDLYLYRCR